MKKLLLIFIFAIGFTTNASANKDTLAIYSVGFNFSCAHYVNGIGSAPITTYTCNVNDTIVFAQTNIPFAINFTVSATPFLSISSSTYFQYKVTSADTPSFLVKGYNPLSATTDLILTVYVNNTTTGINEKTKTNNLTLFPNPTKNTFTVANLKTANISVYNQLGSLVKQQAFENENISVNITDLPQGIYMVEVWADGKRSVSKLVKE
jgi:hypothetical protein